MKSKHLLLVIILVLSLSLVACNKDKTTTTQKQETTTIEDKTTKEDVTTTKEANIQFYMEENVELLKYDRYTINYTLIGTDDAITWTSSDEGVATVAGGVINGIEEGECVITASIHGITLSLNVKVNKNISYPVLVLSDTECMPRVGGEIEFSAYVFFNNQEYHDAELVWSSSNTEIATVNNGMIKGISTGECKILVNTTFNGVKLQEEISVTVVNNPA